MLVAMWVVVRGVGESGGELPQQRQQYSSTSSATLGVAAAAAVAAAALAGSASVTVLGLVSDLHLYLWDSAVAVTRTIYCCFVCLLACLLICSDMAWCIVIAHRSIFWFG